MTSDPEISQVLPWFERAERSIKPQTRERRKAPTGA
jgi:hypothetical protein